MPANVPVSKNIISISCLPYHNKEDRIIDHEEASKRSIASKKMESIKRIPEEEDKASETNKKVSVPIFEETREEAKVEMNEYIKDSKKKDGVLVSRRNKVEGNKRNTSDEVIMSENEIAVPPESKVGARVQEEVQKNVISMIILILLSIPLLDGSTWFTNVTAYDKAQ